MGRRLITLEDVAEIKRHVWLGKLHRDIADQFFVSKAYVSQISCGQVYAQVPWPDGSLGRMSLMRARRIAHGIRKVNRRLPSDVEPVDVTDEMYDEYLRERQKATNERDREESKRLKEYAKTQYLTPEESAKVSSQEKAAPIRKEGRKLSRLLEESPKSRTLSSAIKSADNNLKWATRIILSQLPVGIWEAEATQKMISNLSTSLASEARSSHGEIPSLDNPNATENS